MSQRKPVVLLNPPFFRFVGSHTDRAPLALCYLSAYLEKAGIDHIVYNADYTPSTKYWSMKTLFDNFEPFKDAVDNKGSLYGEVLEGVLSYSPEVVIVMGADPLIPTKDLGSPFIAANFAQRLREHGVYTVGIGPYFTLDQKKFEKSFDCIMAGEPSKKIVEIITNKPQGVIAHTALDTNIAPSFNHLLPAGQRTDLAMTSFGCLYPCAFCIAGLEYRRLGERVKYVTPETAVADIKSRSSESIYLGDLNFTNAPKKRLEELVTAFEAHNVKKKFTIESRVDCLTDEKMALIKKLGVKSVKLGVEGVTEALLKSFNKRTELDDIRRAASLVKDNGLDLVVYLLIGGVTEEKDYEITYQFIKELNPTHIVPNIWAYNLETDYRYDTQFSPERLAQWGIAKEVFYKYLSLQTAYNPTVGELLQSPQPQASRPGRASS